ncbi:MAG TPA: response regulator transcription factor [Chthonomonadaceae bacterium]|nr:response regulator transcription factor [Chthonomonadaceae bacterium]
MQRFLLIGTRDWQTHAAALAAAGYDVRTVVPEEAPLHTAVEVCFPDLLVLESDADALILQHVRRVLRAELNAHPIPLLALTPSAPRQSSLLTVGVDDFILPPYAPDELLARVQMLLWRFQKTHPQQHTQVGGLVLDMARRVVTADAHPVTLTLREFQLLQFLMTHRNRTFTREALMQLVWGYHFEGDVRVVDAYIKRVRARLGKKYGKLIYTVRGIGYLFQETPEE